MEELKAMKKLNKDKQKKRALALLSACAFLSICVIVSIALWVNRIKDRVAEDVDVINIVSDKNVVLAQNTNSETVTKVNNMKFEVSDDKLVWATDTNVEIFHISYDEKGRVTVESKSGDKLIAPGTSNTYSFKLMNSSNAAIDYELGVEASITYDEITIPVEAKFSRYDGVWFAGDKDKWEPVLALDGITDEAVLGADSYSLYTLDWQWPFETVDKDGNIIEGDSIDTLLGNLAVDKDIILTFKFNVIATADENPDKEGGIPKTGDYGHINVYVFAALMTAFMMFIIILLKKREEDDEENVEKQI